MRMRMKMKVKNEVEGQILHSSYLDFLIMVAGFSLLVSYFFGGLTVTFHIWAS